MGKKGFMVSLTNNKVVYPFPLNNSQKVSGTPEHFCDHLELSDLLCCGPSELLQTHFAGNLLQELQQSGTKIIFCT